MLPQIKVPQLGILVHHEEVPKILLGFGSAICGSIRTKILSSILSSSKQGSIDQPYTGQAAMNNTSHLSPLLMSLAVGHHEDDVRFHC